MEAKAMEMIGLDIHRKQCQPTVIDEEGNIHEEKQIETSTEAIRAYFLRHPNAKVAIESTGIWEHVYTTIRSCGNQVVLANPLKTRLIAEARVKTDKVDSRILAMLMKADMLPECYVPDDETREARKDVRERLLMKNIHGPEEPYLFRTAETGDRIQRRGPWIQDRPQVGKAGPGRTQA
jgi:hypothetical protein